MFAALKKGPERLRIIERVTDWTRQRFGLSSEAVVSVSEVACPLPGCPPIETVVVFWLAERRYQFKLFKPVAQVVEEDLPYSWLKDALAVDEGIGWECC